MGAGFVGALTFSLIVNGYLIARDATHGLLAGAIITGAGSLYIFTPAFAILTGFLGGLVQSFIQNYIEKESALFMEDQDHGVNLLLLHLLSLLSLTKM